VSSVGANVSVVELDVVTVKLSTLVASPPGVVTLIWPLVAPEGTVAVICPLLSTLNVVAGVPLNFTALAFVKFEPEMTTLCPIGPDVGEKPEIDGAGITVNELELVAFPAGALTEIAPVVAPEGTVAVICPSLSTLKVVAFVPLKLTTVAPVKPEPEIVTL
jgi:hypothetical protein